MPTPVGHSLAGLCGFLWLRQNVTPDRWVWLLLGCVFLANSPDSDVLLGLMLGDPRSYHHQGTHSLAAAVIVGIALAGLAWWWKLDARAWGLWAGGLYLSHLILDLLVNDPSLPRGAQVLWPLSTAYFISPVTPLGPFHYFDPGLGLWRTMFSLHNAVTVLRELLLLGPFLILAWYLGRSRREDRPVQVQGYDSAQNSTKS